MTNVRHFVCVSVCLSDGLYGHTPSPILMELGMNGFGTKVKQSICNDLYLRPVSKWPFCEILLQIWSNGNWGFVIKFGMNTLMVQRCKGLTCKDFYFPPVSTWRLFRRSSLQLWSNALTDSHEILKNGLGIKRGAMYVQDFFLFRFLFQNGGCLVSIFCNYRRHPRSFVHKTSIAILIWYS